MQYRRLGKTDLDVSVISLGCWPFAGDANWGPQDESDAIAAVHAALDTGINFFDTAPAYGGGSSEQLLGKGLGDRRDEVVVATKAGGDQLTADGLPKACEQSLRDLGTDVIDLYQIHWPSREVPFEETVRAMEALQQAGKIRHFGVSNFIDEDFTAMLPCKRFECNQVAYSLLWRAVEYACTGHCLENDVGIICYCPLAQGLLTGKFASADDVPTGRARSRHFSGERPQARHGEPGAEAETFETIASIGEIAREADQDMTTVSLSWLLTRPAVASVIAGGRSAEQVRQNASAGDVNLSAEIAGLLTEATDGLKEKLGPSADLWAAPEDDRMR